MKIIFLDFDGVLNCCDYLESLDKSSREYDPDRRLCSDRVGLVNRICDATGAKVVISSQWRLSHTVDELEWLLRKRGFTGEIVGKTRVGGTGNRGAQIAEWIGGRDVDQFVIIDDIDTMGALSDRLVQTSFMDGGLTEDHVDRAIEMLGGLAE